MSFETDGQMLVKRVAGGAVLVAAYMVFITCALWFFKFVGPDNTRECVCNCEAPR